jgi:asparagine synthase (glutamine-hydrolysing)
MLTPRAVKRVLPLLRGAAAHPAWVNGSWFDARAIGHTPYEAPSGDMLRDSMQNLLERDGLPQLLHYEDRNSMHFSIESRVPFLDRDLAELAFSLPPQYLLGPDGESKRVLRAALRGLVPDAILDRRDKIGFAAPGGWFRAVAPDVLAATRTLDAARIPLLNIPFLAKACEEIAGGKPFCPELWRPAGYLQWALSNEIQFS